MQENEPYSRYTKKVHNLLKTDARTLRREIKDLI